MNEETLRKLWNGYAKAGYENIYQVRIQRDHLHNLANLFLPSGGGIYLDLGCGTGNMFDLIVERIQPTEVHAVDWSEEMLKKARLKAEVLAQDSDPIFKFYVQDISAFLEFPDNFFDGAVCNLLISYLTCGWGRPLQELSRVIKPGGYLYLGTLLKEWSFTRVLWKHAPREFLCEPITSLRGLKYRRIVAKISRKLKEHGAQFPSQQELVDFLSAREFEKIETVQTYWGGGVALRARLVSEASHI